MSPWFRRRRRGAPSPPEPVVEPVPARIPAPEPQEPEPSADPTGPLSPERFDRALKRLREEHPPEPES